MAYRILHDGTILTDTAAEALMLSEAIRAKQFPSAPQQHFRPPPSLQHFRPPSPQDLPPQEPRAVWWDDFLRALNRNMRNVLAIVHSHPDGITFTELMRALNITNSSVLSGMLSGITKNVEKHGILAHLVIAREAMGYGNERVVTYRPGPLLRNLGVEMPP